MSIKKQRTSLKNNTLDNRLKSKLKENKYMKEAEEDELDDDMSDSSEEEDFNFEDDLGGSEEDFGDDDFDMDEEGDDSIVTDEEFIDDEELTPEQDEWFEDQVDTLLLPNLEEPEEEELLGEADDFDFEEDEFSDEDYGDDMDIEDDSDELAPLDDEGFDDEESENHSIFSDEELEAIIENPNTYDVLGDTLKDEAQERYPGDEDEFSDEELEDDIEDEIDAEAELDAELEEAMQMEEHYQYNYHHKDPALKQYTEADDYEFEDDDTLAESDTPMKGMPKKTNVGTFKKKYQGKHVKDPLQEEVVLAKDNKDLGYEEDCPDLEGTYGKVSDSKGANKGFTPGGGTKKTESEGKQEHKKAGDLEHKMGDSIKEAVRKSKMLVKAAKVIKKLDNKMKQLQLENYRLLKANGILSTVGDRLESKTRSKISESFDRCKTNYQVDELYKNIVKTIKQKVRPSLNEAVSKSKNYMKQVNLKESKETLSLDQQRKNALMGLSTEDDTYMAF